MNLPTEIFGNVVVVHTPEELKSENAAKVEEFLTMLDRNNVVVDLDHTEAIDSRGLTALVSIHENLRDRGGDLKIVTSNSMNRKILEITRLDQQLEVFGTVLEAVQGFH